MRSIKAATADITGYRFGFFGFFVEKRILGLIIKKKRSFLANPPKETTFNTVPQNLFPYTTAHPNRQILPLALTFEGIHGISGIRLRKISKLHIFSFVLFWIASSLYSRKATKSQFVAASSAITMVVNGEAISYRNLCHH